MMLLARAGPLPERADWSHEHADAANTRVSQDQLVKAPLGLLWFGGPSNEAILPRHGHGPQPQVVDGRLFIEGMDMLRAMDIYTGRVLWEKDYVRDFNASIPSWGIAGAPLVDGDRLICLVGGEPDGKVIALDKMTGEEVWRSLSQISVSV